MTSAHATSPQSAHSRAATGISTLCGGLTGNSADHAFRQQHRNDTRATRCV